MSWTCWCNMERFWSKVQKTDECWIWTASRKFDGYGRFWYHGREILAHRFSWKLHNGIIPEGLNVLHKCDNPPCVRPNHLLLGTQYDNIQDKLLKGRYEPLRGVKHGRSKINEASVEYIRKAYKKGSLQKELALMFNLSQQHISAIINEVYWKHVVPVLT